MNKATKVKCNSKKKNNMRHNFPKIKCVFLILLICIYCDGGAKKKIYVDVGREQIRRLLIISYGGLSPEHFYMNETPTLNKLRAIGVYAPYMENVVPPTPPSTLQSIVTGMYPSEHGAYGFRFWDMLRGVTENADVYTANRGVLPIWVSFFFFNFCIRVFQLLYQVMNCNLV